MQAFLEIDPALENDQHAQQAQVQQQNEIIQKTIDTGECDAVVGDAGKEKNDGQEGFCQSRAEFRQQRHHRGSGNGGSGA